MKVKAIHVYILDIRRQSTNLLCIPASKGYHLEPANSFFHITILSWVKEAPSLTLVWLRRGLNLQC